MTKAFMAISFDEPRVCFGPFGSKRNRARRRRGAEVAAIVFALLVAVSGCGDSGNRDVTTTEALLRWNRIAIDASGLDHTPPAPGETRTYAENYGPGRSSRAMAIVHVAIFESLIAIHGGYESYVGLRAGPPTSSPQAAIARAAHDTLAALYPAQADRFAAALQDGRDEIPDGLAEDYGEAIGRAAAVAILAHRDGDGADHLEPTLEAFPTGEGPGEWKQDPVSRYPVALGAYWHTVRPFVIPAADAFRAPPFPPLDSVAYATAFDEVRALGGDGVVTPTVRSEEQTFIGTFWAYDGTPSLCAPPRLYNQVATTVAASQGLEGIELARLLALVNVALADSGIAVWESKYHYALWRPVTGVREAAFDGNDQTDGDAAFLPLGAPASNLTGPNFTPPFPAYPSGHAGFGGALFEMLRNYFGRDEVAFTFVSDEFNGRTRDNQGKVRPRRPRHFTSLSAAEEENGQSRIYLGIHWSFDKTAGIAQGNAIADYVFEHLYRPIR